MKYILFFLTSFVFIAPLAAQEQTGGIFYPDCGPAKTPAITMELDSHIRITVFKPSLAPDEAYRTLAQVFEGEEASMKVEMCDAAMKECKPVEGILTAYKDDGEAIEAALEYFDGTETQGDSESIEGHTQYFKIQRDKNRAAPTCP